MQTATRLTSTLLSGLAGAVFVGLATAIIFAVAPASGFPSGVAELALALLFGAAFGAIAGAVAGRSKVEPEP